MVTEGLSGHAYVLGIGIDILGLVEVATKDIGINCDGGGCVQVVASDHADCDAGLLALLDGILDSGLKRVCQAIEGYHCHIFCEDFDLVIDLL